MDLPCQASGLLLVPGKEMRAFVHLRPGREMSNCVNCNIFFTAKDKLKGKIKQRYFCFVFHESVHMYS